MVPCSPPIFTPRLLLVPLPAGKLLLQRILLATRSVYQLLQAVLARGDGPDGVVLDLLACLAEEFVGGVFLVGVEVCDFDLGFLVG